MILVLGGSGYVGSAIVAELKRRGTDFRCVRRAETDYTCPESLRKLLKASEPEFVVNCAGYTGKPNVDACELHKAECLAGNAVLPGTIRRICEEQQIPWGHVSSGCIYTGTRSDGAGFEESDPPNFSFRQDNCSFYSGTKALGEEVLDDDQNCYIWRLRIPFSAEDSGRNYLSKVMRYDRLLDAVNSLSQLDEFAAACIDSWTRRIPFGIYNLTNPGSVSTRRVTQILTEEGVTDREFSFFDSEHEFMQIAAKTPRSNCVLDSSKAIAAGLKLTPVEDAIRRCAAAWRAAR